MRWRRSTRRCGAGSLSDCGSVCASGIRGRRIGELRGSGSNKAIGKVFGRFTASLAGYRLSVLPAATWHAADSAVFRSSSTAPVSYLNTGRVEPDVSVENGDNSGMTSRVRMAFRSLSARSADQRRDVIFAPWTEYCPSSPTRVPVVRSALARRARRLPPDRHRAP